MYWHTNPTFLYTYARTQPTATTTSHVIAKYVTETICQPHWTLMSYMPNI